LKYVVRVFAAFVKFEFKTIWTIFTWWIVFVSWFEPFSFELPSFERNSRCA